jgi:hypothetical protein
MGLSILDVLPEEAHRKDLLRQAEAHRIAKRVQMAQACERNSPPTLLVYLGHLLVSLGRKLQNQAVIQEGSVDIAVGLK